MSHYTFHPLKAVGRQLTDVALDGVHTLAGTYRRLDRLAQDTPVREVLVVGVYESGSRAPEAVAELRRTRHRVSFAYGSRDPEPDPALREETIACGMDGLLVDNRNRLLGLAGRDSPADWTITIDSDVRLTPRWLDRFVAACELFDLSLAQPANTRRSYESYDLTRRALTAIARETRFVEIGPVTAFRADAARELLPFPDDAGMGWGLDLVWSRIAAEHGWRMGIVDVAPIRHEDKGHGNTYMAQRAADAQERFLGTHPHASREEALRTIRSHRRLAAA